MTQMVVLDSLFDDLDVESAAARNLGVELRRWDGNPASLANAECVVHVRTRVDESLMAAMPRCRVVGRFGSGLDSVDLEAARRAGIEVVGVRDYCIPELPAHTLALAFALQRRLFETANTGDPWSDIAEQTPMHRGARAVVVGLGAVGRRVAQALVALGYDVAAVTRTTSLAKDAGVEAVPLDDALASADLLFLQTSLDETTRGLLNADRLARLKPNTFVVNTARLELIDQAATASALQAGRIGGLALDAILPDDSPLAKFKSDPRVLISPHVGWYSEESAAELRRRCVEATIDALELQERKTDR